MKLQEKVNYLITTMNYQEMAELNLFLKTFL